MITRIFFCCSLIIASMYSGTAQDHKAYDLPGNMMFGVTWNVNIPVDNPYINTTSFNGMRFEWSKFIKHNLSVGFETGWSSYKQYTPRQTYHVNDNGDITTDKSAYMYTIPFALNVHHYFGSGKNIHPYAGIALGANYCKQHLYMNIYGFEDNNWGFLVKPEVGLMAKFSSHSNTMLLLGAAYNYATNSEDSFKTNGLRDISFKLGVAFFSL